MSLVLQRHWAAVSSQHVALRSEVRQLRSTSRETKDLLDISRRELSDAHAKIAALSQQLDAEEARHGKEARELETRLHASTTNAARDKRHLESRLVEAQQQQRAAESRAADLLSQRDALRAAHDASQLELDRVVRLLQDVQAQVESLASTASYCQAEAQRAHGDVRQLETTATWMQRAQASLNEAIEGKARRVEELEKEGAAVGARAAEAAAKAGEVHQQMMEKAVALAAAEGRLAAVKAEAAAGAAMLKQAERDKAALLQQMRQLQANGERSAATIRELQTLLADATLRRNGETARHKAAQEERARVESAQVERALQVEVAPQVESVVTASMPEAVRDEVDDARVEEEAREEGEDDDATQEASAEATQTAAQDNMSSVVEETGGGAIMPSSHME